MSHLYGWLVVAGLALSTPLMASCSAEAAETDVVSTQPTDAVDDTSRRAAEPSAERLAAPTARVDAPQAPRARWHRYLPGMFK